MYTHRRPAPRPTIVGSMVALGLALAALPLVGTAHAEEPPPTELTLEAAVETAFRNSPRLRVQRAQISEAEARVTTADTYPFNPELEVQGAARIGPDEVSGDVEVGVWQELELGGQQDKRVVVARAEVQAARSERSRFERLLAAEIHLVFLDALEARELRDLSRAEAELAEQLLGLAKRRLEAGAGTQLEVNVASVELGQAEQAIGASTGDYAAARAVLAEVLGLPAVSLPEPIGSLEPGADTLPPLADLIAEAETNRADLHALRDIEQAAHARIELARAEAWPSMRIGVFAGMEANTEALVGAGISIPLPFFQTNEGPIAEAEAAVVRIGAERDVARISVAREVVTAYERHRAGMESLRALSEGVIGTTEETLELLRKAFEAGKTGWTDVLVMRRALFDARRAHIETSAKVRRARVRIDIASERLPLPTGAGAE